MSAFVTSLKLDMAPSQRRSPFVLSVGDDQGAVPVRVTPKVVHAWSRKPGVYDALLDDTLRMKTPGVRRVRLYCPVRVASEARLVVHGGQARYVGRRTEPLVETVTWIQNRARSLRFFHDRPDLRILEQTRFFDNHGHEVSPPAYVPSKGGFRHDQEVTGAMMVSYDPGFSLYEIQYDTGEAQMSASAFREVKLAWLAGNIRDAIIPPVRIIALSGEHATQVSFPRAFWPEHSAVRQWFQEDGEEPAMIPVAGGFRVDPDSGVDACWARCKEKVKPEDNYLTAEDRQAILDCVEQGKNPRYHYVESKRTAKTERIHSQNDPEVYVDVERPVELIFRLQRADDAPCVDPAPPPCCPELILRFQSN